MAIKVVPVLMEDSTDADTLIDVFNELLQDRPQLRDRIMSGDITLYRSNAMQFHVSKDDSPSQVLSSVVKQGIKAPMAGYKPRDILAVAHIVDLDGAMISPEQVIKGRTFRYLDDRIETPNVEAIRERNETKSQTIKRMSSLRDLGVARGIRVPYYMFYMSRNLEHALWGLSGDLTPEEKKTRAKRMQSTYMKNPAAFMELLRSEDILHGQTDYHESWEWPSQGSNSLLRGSNIAFLPGLLQKLL